MERPNIYAIFSFFSIFVVPFQQRNKNNNAYGTNTYRGADKSAEEHYDEDGRERLGIHSRAVRGRPTLGNRWDTLPYEEGLWTVEIGDKLGSPKPSVRKEINKESHPNDSGWLSLLMNYFGEYDRGGIG